MISSTQMRPGMVVKFNNDLFSVFSVAHRTPGNLRGFVQAKMRNLKSGTMIEHRFSSEDKVERAILDEVEMEYLYDDGQNYYFMDTANYEQTHLSKELLGDATNYLIPQLKVKVEFYEGKPMSVDRDKLLADLEEIVANARERIASLKLAADLLKSCGRYRWVGLYDVDRA